MPLCFNKSLIEPVYSEKKKHTPANYTTLFLGPNSPKRQGKKDQMSAMPENDYALIAVEIGLQSLVVVVCGEKQIR